MVDQRTRPFEGALVRTAGRIEMARVKSPERLDGEVEGTARGQADAVRLAQQIEQLERRLDEPAVPVEPADRAVGAIQAEDPLDALPRQRTAGTPASAAAEGAPSAPAAAAIWRKRRLELCLLRSLLPPDPPERRRSSPE
jgi:hypothetical protein